MAGPRSRWSLRSNAPPVGSATSRTSSAVVSLRRFRSITRSQQVSIRRRSIGEGPCVRRAPTIRRSTESEDSMIKHSRRRFVSLAAAAAALAVVAQAAGAEGYPSRPIMFIVPTAAGGPQDVVARIVAERMQGSLGQPIIIENVPGATGTIGIGNVARATPDGYTLAFSVSFSTHVVNPAIFSLPYDVINDFEPVARAAPTPQLIVAKASMPANNLKELIAWLKANPDKATLGHIGPGSPAHVAGILLQKQSGTRFRFVTYRGAGQAIQDLIAGHIDLMITAPTIALEEAR